MPAMPHAPVRKEPAAAAARRWPSALGSRIGLVLATAALAISLFAAHVEYLNPTWEYMGFTYRPLDGYEWALVALLLGPVAATLPARFTHASSVFLFLLHVVVFVPGVVITMSLAGDRLGRYLPFLATLTIAFLVASAAAGRSPVRAAGSGHSPGALFEAVFMAAWLAMAAILFVQYRSVLAFVALDDVYEQRAAGASAGLLAGYVQTYFGNVVSPTLLALGLVRRRWLPLVTGVAGCVLMYSINAQKTIILLPLIMVAVHWMMRARRALARAVALPVAALAALTHYAMARVQEDVVAGVLALFLVHRTVAVPGLTLSQYHDQFATEGFTYWSHVRGINLFVSPPAQYASDPLWPGLGYMLGDRLFNYPEFNMNANLFSGDGLAAAGALGVLVIGLVFAIYLWLLDRASRAWDPHFVVLAVLPVAIAITNGHFFTTLLSFGGIFWLVVFAWARPGGTRAAAAAQPQEAPRS